MSNMLDYEKDFEEIVNTYSGIPLKENFMETGNTALESYGVQAVLKDGVIRIHFADRPLYDEDEINELAEDDEMEEALANWKISIDACIQPGKHLADGIQDSFYTYEILTPEHIEGLEEEYDICPKEYDQAIRLVEAFLNAAVDCE